ncbi:MAG: BapA prefix-like domain-containing protein [Desulfovibrionaceae bacterium]|jgi:hypothetical protein|nr:BapA prefix-like domain-containing protein [Desulfovibrionaceae bacterium]
MTDAQSSWTDADQVAVDVPTTVEVSESPTTTVKVLLPATVEAMASDRPANFVLHTSASEISQQAREGDDLVLTMVNGGVVRINGFFAHGEEFNHLTFVAGDQVQQADVPAATAPAESGEHAAQATAATPATPWLADVDQFLHEAVPSLGTQAAGDEDAHDYGSLLYVLGALAVGGLGVGSINNGSKHDDAAPAAAESRADATDTPATQPAGADSPSAAGQNGSESSDALSTVVLTAGQNHAGSTNGGGGNDTFNLQAGDGHVKLVYELLDPADPTGGNGSGVANGFHVGNVNSDADADLIDLSQLLAPASSSNLGDYLSVTISGADTVIAVDLTGSGNAFTPLLTLTNVHTTLDELTANQQIVA